MALAVTSTPASAFPASNPVTFSVTVTAGANGLLLVGLALNGATPPSITSVTYNGVAMTQRVLNSDAGRLALAVWYELVAPSVGTFNVVITLASGSGNFGGVAAVITGADQTTPCDASVTATADGVDLFTENITTVTANALLVDLFSQSFAGTAGTNTPGAGQTSMVNIIDAPGFDAIGASYKSAAGAGAQSMSWTGTHSSHGTLNSVVYAVRPAGGGGTPVLQRLTMLGCG